MQPEAAQVHGGRSGIATLLAGAPLLLGPLAAVPLVVRALSALVTGLALLPLALAFLAPALLVPAVARALLPLTFLVTLPFAAALFVRHLCSP
jgi:hypothetical protein